MEKKNALSIILNRELVLKTVHELLCTWSHYLTNLIRTTSKGPYHPHFTDKTAHRDLSGLVNIKELVAELEFKPPSLVLY